MYSQPLDAVPLWALALIIVALLAIALEAGYRIGWWRHARTPDEKEQPVGAMVASILGLLALVLGFTFSLAASRFDARRVTVLEEANAIGTTFLRTRLLAEPERSAIADLLREYVEVRIITAQSRDVEKGVARAEELHRQLWDQATAAADKTPNSEMTALFVQSLNEAIELHAIRVHVALRSRIPMVIFLCLYGMTLLGMVAVGYQSGLSATRRSPAMLVMSLAFAVVLLLIADLDRSQEGLLRIGQHALIDVQRIMESPPPEN